MKSSTFGLGLIQTLFLGESFDVNMEVGINIKVCGVCEKCDNCIVQYLYISNIVVIFCFNTVIRFSHENSFWERFFK